MITSWLRAALLASLGSLPQEAAKTRDVEITYVQNSGWIVKTPGHVLVFDYVEAIPGSPPLLPEVVSVLEGIGDRALVVFISHSHGDHYAPVIYKWRTEGKPRHVEYVFGWPGAPPLPTMRSAGPRESFSVKGVSVKTTASTDEGVGFLVSVDGLTLYHAGDHARWTDASAEAFEAEIRWLADQGARIDIAFMPIATGVACDPRPSIWQGALFATLVLKPGVLFPMHVRCPEKIDLYQKFSDHFSPYVQPTRIIAPARPGESISLSGSASAGWVRGPITVR